MGYIPNFLGGTNVIIKVFISEREMQKDQRERCDDGRSLNGVIVGFKDGSGPGIKEYGQPLETQKRKRMDSAFEPTEGIWSVNNLLTH